MNFRIKLQLRKLNLEAKLVKADPMLAVQPIAFNRHKALFFVSFHDEF